MGWGDGGSVGGRMCVCVWAGWRAGAWEGDLGSDYNGNWAMGEGETVAAPSEFHESTLVPPPRPFAEKSEDPGPVKPSLPTPVSGTTDLDGTGTDRKPSTKAHDGMAPGPPKSVS